MRHLPLSLALASAALLPATAACDLVRRKAPVEQDAQARAAALEASQMRRACASDLTYHRLKELAFDDAVRVRSGDPRALDKLATYSTVRMEQPLVKSRDDALNVTVCTGHFVLELPPGSERQFGGDRRLTADIEYAAQAAADGSGLVYQMKGAEPIVYKLAAYGLSGAPLEALGPPPTATPAPAPVEVAAADPPPVRSSAPPPPSSPPVPRAAPPPEPARTRVAEAPPPRPSPRTQPDRAPAPPPVRTAGNAHPAFNCRYAKTRSEQMICGNDRLSALDRTMSAQYYSALGETEGEARAELRRTRDRFLSYRERCRTEACVEDAYRGRIQEIRDIAADR